MIASSLRMRRLCFAAVVGALYAVLTLLLAPISYGAVQLRVAELLCILPYFAPVSAWGLFAGCALANLMSGNLFDVVFGSLATLAAALLTARLGRRKSPGTGVLACLAPVVLNALVVGAVITAAYEGQSLLDRPGLFAMNALWVAAGEAAVLLAMGYPLLRLLPKKALFRDMISRLGYP